MTRPGEGKLPDGKVQAETEAGGATAAAAVEEPRD